MKLVSEPTTTEKIRKMKQRIRWKDTAIVERNIDQTSLFIDDGKASDVEFSFLVVGDSGTGSHRGHSPMRRVAELMLPHYDDCRFMLHTGDVVYQVGSSEYYSKNFIKPYREAILGGEDYKKIAYDEMVFKLPILPVLGNHDYYDLPIIFGLISATTLPFRRLIPSKLDIEVGRHGSHKGDAFARAFLDYLSKFKFPGELARHLDEYYTAKTDAGRCLRYVPGEFTRLPNRYYTFRYGGIDFFALDSNTINDPLPLPETKEGQAYRSLLQKRRDELEQEQEEIRDISNKLNPDDAKDAEQIDDLQSKLSQIEEMIVDINKQLDSSKKPVTDTEQLEWFKQRLIESWNSSEVRGRVVYFHHPPYVTEATKWEQAQTLAVRSRIRHVLNAVAGQVKYLTQGRPIVDLVLNGHAHCMEHIETLDTGNADSNTNWIVCGGSGHSLRRQRPEGADLWESNSAKGKTESKSVARSHLFIGRNGSGSNKRRPYSGLRIDVKEGSPPKFVVKPLVAERYQRQWYQPKIESFTI
ncbi:Calcineurin-like phosphoesterase [Rivularia sp. PCC 7116]|uniref:metallophosphoesterase family protein n=1 Tax=Rivularia sp. PCC 7116 TaxID=373994 RepID=UPI00029ECF13|nr:metallophosphoesterase [Rivularia sp. PCC 7116]AFY53886.1 Calcineurin-like phosphoesterase [Rivularia sp. PCC 7116]